MNFYVFESNFWNIKNSIINNNNMKYQSTTEEFNKNIEKISLVKSFLAYKWISISFKIFVAFKKVILVLFHVGPRWTFPRPITHKVPFTSRALSKEVSLSANAHLLPHTYLDLLFQHHLKTMP